MQDYYQSISKIFKEKCYQKFFIIPDSIPISTPKYFKYLYDKISMKPILKRQSNNEDFLRRQSKYDDKVYKLKRHLGMIESPDFKFNNVPGLIQKKNVENIHNLCMVFYEFKEYHDKSFELIPLISEFILEEIKIKEEFINIPENTIRVNDSIKFKQIISRIVCLSEEEKKILYETIDNSGLISISHIFANNEVREIFLKIHKFFYLSELLDPIMIGLDTS